MLPQGTGEYYLPIRDQFFINRVIPLWNYLPQNITEGRTLNSFKAGLDSLRSFSAWKGKYKFLNLTC